jgi:hypothetical protein
VGCVRLGSVWGRVGLARLLAVGLLKLGWIWLW